MSSTSIYSILSSISHNKHYLCRYLTFIESRKFRLVIPGEYYETHHICPTSLFPSFSDLRINFWNGIKLTPREHYISHWILSKAILNHKMTMAFNFMVVGHGSKRYIPPTHKNKRYSSGPPPKKVCRLYDRKEMDMSHFNQWNNRSLIGIKKTKFVCRLSDKKELDRASWVRLTSGTYDKVRQHHKDNPEAHRASLIHNKKSYRSCDFVKTNDWKEMKKLGFEFNYHD